MKVRATSVLLLLLAFASVPAKADTLTADFTIFNSGAPIAPPPPYGTLQLSLNNDGSVTFTVTPTPGYTLLVESQPIAPPFPPNLLFPITVFAFNVIGPTTGLTITGLPAGWLVNSPPYVCAFSCYQEAILGPPGVTQALSSLTFTVNRNGGFSSVGDFVTWNGEPAAFAARLLPVTGDPSAPFGGVGFAGAVPTPEPASLFLFISGLAGMGAVVRQRRRKPL